MLAPVRPVIEVLQTPLPVISQIAGRNFTLLDMAELFVPIFGGEASPETRRFIKAAADLNSLMNFVQNVSASGKIDLGSYQVSGGSAPGSRQIDVRTGTLSQIDPSKLIDQVTGIVADNISLAGKLDPVSKAFVDRGQSVPAGNGSGDGFSLPILKSPMGILQILLGRQDVTLFKYDMPQLKFTSPFSVGPFPIFPPFLTLFFGGNIGAQADFNFGFDTKGFVTGNPLDGFFIEDTLRGVKGAFDPLEVSLFANVEAGAYAGIDLGIFSVMAGAAGGLFADVGFNLHDPNRDGKVHLPELLENLGRGPEWVFDLQGSFGAYLRAFIKIELDLDCSR